MESPALKRLASAGVRIVAVGGLPTLMVTLLERVELSPSETVTRAVYCPDVWYVWSGLA